MFTKVALFTIILLFWSSSVFGQMRIIHNKPDGYLFGQPFEIEALIQGSDQSIQQVTLYFKQAGDNVYRETSMEFRYGYYIGQVPSEVTASDTLHYIISAEMSNGQQVIYPENNPFENPVVLSAISNGQKSTTNAENDPPQERQLISLPVAQERMIISPVPGESVPSDELLIAVSLFYFEEMDTNSVIVSFDGDNVTAQSKISENLIIYKPQDISPGNHQVQILLKDAEGNSYETISWIFQVDGEQDATSSPLSLNGRLYLETSQAEIRNQTENINKLSGSLRGDYKNISVDGSLYLTSQENRNAQPRNRYLLRARGNNFYLELGDSYPRLSELGMWGKRLRGLNSGFSMGKFNMHLVYGRSVRPEAGRIIPLTHIPDQEGVTHEIAGYTFGRRTIAVRPSFGDKRRFQLGFSLISSRDDTLSIKDHTDDIPVEEIQWGGIRPKDNIIIGSDLFLAFDQQRITWESSVALSWQNNNIFGGAIDDDEVLEFGNEYVIRVDELPLNPSKFDWLFIINNNMYPYLPIPAKYRSTDSDAGGFNLELQPLKFHEYRSAAYETKLHLNYFQNNLALRYRAVGDAYNALMNPYMRSDIAGFEISDRIYLLQNRLFANVAYENLTEGLSLNDENQIDSEHIRVGVSLYPGGDFPSVHVNHSIYDRHNKIDTITRKTLNIGGQDSLLLYDNRIDNTLTTSSLNISQPFYIFTLQNQIGLHYMHSARADQVSREDNPRQEYTLNMLSVSLQSRYNLPLVTRLSYTLNNNDGTFGLSKFQTLSAGFRYHLLQEKLSLNANFQRTSSTGQAEFNRNDLESTVYYNIMDKHKISANARYSIMEYISDEFSDFIYRLRYTYEF